MIELHHNAISAARDAGVTHVVKVSAFAASDRSRAPIGLWQYQVEQELQASGMGWTILRPHHFMQNILEQAKYIIQKASSTHPPATARSPTSTHETSPRSRS